MNKKIQSFQAHLTEISRELLLNFVTLHYVLKNFFTDS